MTVAGMVPAFPILVSIFIATDIKLIQRQQLAVPFKAGLFTTVFAHHGTGGSNLFHLDCHEFVLCHRSVIKADLVGHILMLPHFDLFKRALQDLFFQEYSHQNSDGEGTDILRCHFVQDSTFGLLVLYGLFYHNRGDGTLIGLCDKATEDKVTHWQQLSVQFWIRCRTCIAKKSHDCVIYTNWDTCSLFAYSTLLSSRWNWLRERSSHGRSLSWHRRICKAMKCVLPSVLALCTAAFYATARYGWGAIG